MDPNSIIEYISFLDKEHRKKVKVDNISLDILQQFAFDGYLSAYNLCSKLNSTGLKIAYKNVNKRVHALVLSGLILETKPVDI